MAFNSAHARDDGSRSEDCVHRCAPAFHPDGQWERLEYFVNNASEHQIYDYILIHPGSSHTYETAVWCYGREEPFSDESPPEYKFPGTPQYCPLGEKCTVTVAQKSAASPALYYAGCQPNNTDLCTNQGCRNNSMAPYIGEGEYKRVCDWCCGYSQCNNIKNCTGDECHFYGEPRNITGTIHDNDDDTSEASMMYTMNVFPVLLTSIICYFNHNVI